MTKLEQVASETAMHMRYITLPACRTPQSRIHTSLAYLHPGISVALLGIVIDDIGAAVISTGELQAKWLLEVELCGKGPSEVQIMDHRNTQPSFILVCPIGVAIERIEGSEYLVPR